MIYRGHHTHAGVADGERLNIFFIFHLSKKERG